MRIILDTDKKLITVPWNYAAKLDEMNRIIQQGGGTKKYDFKSYINEMWNECMENTDAHLKVADKPAKRGKQDGSATHNAAGGSGDAPPL